MSKFKIGSHVFVKGATLAGLFKVVGIQKLDGKNRSNPPGCYYSLGNLADPSTFMDMVPESSMATPSEIRNEFKKSKQPTRGHEVKPQSDDSGGASCTNTQPCESLCDPCPATPDSGASDKKLFAFGLGDTVSIIDEHRRVIDGGNLYRVACRSHTESATDDPDEEANYNLYHLMPLAGGEMQIAKECCLQHAPSETESKGETQKARQPGRASSGICGSTVVHDGLIHSQIILNLYTQAKIPVEVLRVSGLVMMDLLQDHCGVTLL